MLDMAGKNEGPPMSSRIENPISELLREQDKVSKLMRDAVDSPIMRMVREQDRVSKLMRDAVDSPVMRMVREQDRVSKLMRDAVDSPIMRMVREQDRVSKLMRDAVDSPIMRMLREQDKVSKLMRDAVDSPVMQMLREQGKASKLMRDAVNGSTMRMLREFGDQSRLIREAADLFPSEMRALNSDVAIAVEAAAGQNFETDAFWEAVVRICGHLMTMLRNARSALELRRTWGLAEFLIPLIFAFYLAYASDQHVTQVGKELRQEMQDQELNTEARLADRQAERTQQQYDIDSKLDELLVLANERANALGQRTFYLVKRAVPLCAERKLCRGHVAYLSPGDDVELLERAGKWLRVEAITDDGQTINGWVLKKYLRRER
ncbi:MAG TPA: hypothetical protein VFV07_04970 [Rhizomicrobium sp.]|nr:hypothetical protein [Rhizomicrobium sp.]